VDASVDSSSWPQVESTGFFSFTRLSLRVPASSGFQ